MTTTVSTQLPPVPSAQIFSDKSGLLTQPAQQWLINLRDKVNQINSVLVAIAGTGSAAGAFDYLSPLTTKGDLLVYNGTHNVREAVGADGYVLTADSTSATGVSWKAPTGGGSGGILPVVTGDINNSQPTFTYLDNGSLIYVQVQ